jgi:hypothetical protein
MSTSLQHRPNHTASSIDDLQAWNQALIHHQGTSRAASIVVVETAPNTTIEETAPLSTPKDELPHRP